MKNRIQRQTDQIAITTACCPFAVSSGCFPGECLQDFDLLLCGYFFRAVQWRDWGKKVMSGEQLLLPHDGCTDTLFEIALLFASAKCHFRPRGWHSGTTSAEEFWHCECWGFAMVFLYVSSTRYKNIQVVDIKTFR